MKVILLSIVLLLNLNLKAQEKFKTSDFNWSPKTETIENEIFYFNPENQKKEWSKTERYIFTTPI